MPELVAPVMVKITFDKVMLTEEILLSKSFVTNSEYPKIIYNQELQSAENIISIQKEDLIISSGLRNESAESVFVNITGIKTLINTAPSPQELNSFIAKHYEIRNNIEQSYTELSAKMHSDEQERINEKIKNNESGIQDLNSIRGDEEKLNEHLKEINQYNTNNALHTLEDLKDGLISKISDLEEDNKLLQEKLNNLSKRYITPEIKEYSIDSIHTTLATDNLQFLYNEKKSLEESVNNLNKEEEYNGLKKSDSKKSIFVSQMI